MYSFACKSWCEQAFSCTSGPLLLQSLPWFNPMILKQKWKQSSHQLICNNPILKVSQLKLINSHQNLQSWLLWWCCFSCKWKPYRNQGHIRYFFVCKSWFGQVFSCTLEMLLLQSLHHFHSIILKQKWNQSSHQCLHSHPILQVSLLHKINSYLKLQSWGNWVVLLHDACFHSNASYEEIKDTYCTSPLVSHRVDQYFNACWETSCSTLRIFFDITKWFSNRIETNCPTNLSMVIPSHRLVSCNWSIPL